MNEGVITLRSAGDISVGGPGLRPGSGMRMTVGTGRAQGRGHSRSRAQASYRGTNVDVHNVRYVIADVANARICTIMNKFIELQRELPK